MPAVLMVLALSIFPLIVSFYLSFSRFKFVKGGFEINFIGLDNFRKLFAGSEQRHFLGSFRDPGPTGWFIFGLLLVVLALFLVRYIRSHKFSVSGLFWRSVMGTGIISVAWLVVHTLFSEEGRPGSVGVTLVYVFVGTFFQFSIGLGLALLATQNLPGPTFFPGGLLITDDDHAGGDCLSLPHVS